MFSDTVWHSVFYNWVNFSHKYHKYISESIRVVKAKGQFFHLLPKSSMTE